MYKRQDYLFFDNFDGAITDPESLCVRLCRSHYGVGADGIVLIGASEAAEDVYKRQV